eukprot:1491156-Amphidinium_carterae.1
MRKPLQGSGSKTRYNSKIKGSSGGTRPYWRNTASQQCADAIPCHKLRSVARKREGCETPNPPEPPKPQRI